MFVIIWYYKDEDEDMLEKGRFFSMDLNVPFNYIKDTGFSSHRGGTD